jgi:leucyl-tRNA synthetase
MVDTRRDPKKGRYDPSTIEAKWQKHWTEHGTFRTPDPDDPSSDSGKPKFYILDFFPYPSGAGLHVGHPLGYCATDVVARYKRMRGFNVLHPMGFDAFGLPAEQYAVEHNVHPAITTERNIHTYRRQLKTFGFSYDWDREIATCHADYYKFTQWIFLQMFRGWYDDECRWTDATGREVAGRARPIEALLGELEAGRWGVGPSSELIRDKDASGRREWADLTTEERRKVIDGQRLAYLDEVPVNWCPALGTVLSNEEVDNEGRSDRGAHPVYRRPLKQWMLRITKYGDRLLGDLDELDWPEAIKLMQRNWIGRSTGADVIFPLADKWAMTSDGWKCLCGKCAEPPALSDFPDSIRVYTTRPDTLFGATYMVLAPEHELVERITTDAQREAVRAYVETARHKSELDRTADTKEKTGVFTGAFAINPVNGERIPIWIADYVMMGYGTGAIMAVPAHDTRDFEFAKKFDIPIVGVVQPDDEWLHEQIRGGAVDHDYCDRKGKGELAKRILESATQAACTIGGITAQDATALVDGDPGFIRQVLLPAYVDDPGILVEVFTGEGINVNSPSSQVASSASRPLCDINSLPTKDAKAKITAWLEQNEVGKEAVNFKLRDWLFSRQRYWGEPFPILHGPDGEVVGVDESELPVSLPEMEHFAPVASDDPAAPPQMPLSRAPASWRCVERDGTRYERELNTMPQWAGSCWYYLRFIDPRNEGRCCGSEAEAYWMPVDLYVGGAEHAVLHLLYARFWHKVLYDLGHVSTREPFAKLFNQGMIQSFAYRTSRGLMVGPDAIEERGEDDYVLKETGEAVTRIVAKMSKSLKNVVGPDEVIAKYGADTFRLYEMYMGPLDAPKPWNTRDVPGLFKLCQRIWRLVVDEHTGELSRALVDKEPDAKVLRVLHQTLKRATEDLELLKLNTAIAAMFNFVNVLTPLAERPKKAIEPFVLLLSPFAPHLAEELWQRLGHDESLAYEPWPAYDEALAKEDEVEIGVQIMGKMKSRVMVAADADEKAIEDAALADEKVKRALEGKKIRKVIVVKGRLVNIVAN